MKLIIPNVLLLLSLFSIVGCRADLERVETPSAIDIFYGGVEAKVESIGNEKGGDRLLEKQSDNMSIREDRNTSEYHAMVIQFDDSGNILHHSSVKDVSMTEDYQTKLPNFDLAIGDNQQMILYMLPFGQDTTLFRNVVSLAELLQVQVPWIGDGLNESYSLIGHLDGVDVSHYGISYSEGKDVFFLKRAGCRVDFTFDFKVPDYTLKSITLNNIPQHTSSDFGATVYPRINSEQLKTLQFIPDKQSAVYRWFLPPNARGIGKNLTGNPYYKIEENAPDNYCTWLQLECVSNQDSNKIVRFNLFLGSDAINDYNLLANHAYTMNVSLKGLNKEDLRIEGLEILDYWIEVIDWKEEVRKQKPYYVQYLLSDGNWITSPVNRNQGNRFYYELNNQSLPENENATRSIKLIRLLDNEGQIMNWSSSENADIPTEGDLIIPFDINTLKEGLNYSWIFQGIYNKENCYEVCTPRTLSNVRRLLSGDFKQISPVNLSSQSSWNPIGSIKTGNPFTGSYYGNGYCVDNLKLQEVNTKEAMGLFGYALDAHIDGVRIGSSARIYCLGLYTGAIVGIATNCHITRCSNASLINIRMEHDGGRHNSTYVYTGGIVGYLKHGKILDCYNTGEVGNHCWWYKGAVGNIAGAFEYEAGSSISGCFTTGSNHNINGNEDAVYKAAIFGIGYNISVKDGTFLPGGSIIDCYGHKEKTNFLSAFPINTNKKYLIGDGYGLPLNQGMKSQAFVEILNGNRGTEWGRDDRRNNGYPYLRIEK